MALPRRRRPWTAAEDQAIREAARATFAEDRFAVSRKAGKAGAGRPRSGINRRLN